MSIENAVSPRSVVRKRKKRRSDTRSLRIRQRVSSGKLGVRAALDELAGSVPDYCETSTYQWLQSKLDAVQCKATVKRTGKRCSREAVQDGYCHQHVKMATA